MKTEKRQTYLTPRVIRLGVIASALLVPFGLCVIFLGVGSAISYGSGLGGPFFIVGIIIAAGIPLYLLNARRRLQAFNNDAITTTAEIVHLESKRAKDSNTNDLSTMVLIAVTRLLTSEPNTMDYLLTFQFDAQGSDNTVKPMRLQAKVSQEFYDTFALGQRAQVRYARAYPRIAFLKGEIGYYKDTTY